MADWQPQLLYPPPEADGRRYLDGFGNNETGNARERHAFVFAPTGLPQLVVGFLLAVGLPLASHDQKFPRHESGDGGFGVRRIRPEVHQ